MYLSNSSPIGRKENVDLSWMTTFRDIKAINCLPFSTKGLTPISSQTLPQFSPESNLTCSLSVASSSSVPVFKTSQVNPNYSTSPSSSSTPASSPSLFTVGYQNDDKIGNTGQDCYSVSDDISDLTPSLTTTDLDHQLINAIDYSNVGSIQEFLVEFEKSSEQTFQQPDTIIECAPTCVSGILS